MSVFVNPRWREVRFSRVPSGDHALRLASEARGLLPAGTPGRQLAAGLLDICGFQYAEIPLPGFWPRIDAMLQPSSDGSFTVAISGELVRLNVHGSGAPVEFLIAHEIAHSFFYDRRRLLPQRLTEPSVEEETFCDLFARHFLLPNLELPSFPILAWLQQVSAHACVSLGTVAYIAATHIKDVALLMAVSDREIPRVAWITGTVPTGLSDWMHGLAQDGEWVTPTLRDAVLEDALVDGRRGPRYLAIRSNYGAPAQHAEPRAKGASQRSQACSARMAWA